MTPDNQAPALNKEMVSDLLHRLERKITTLRGMALMARNPAMLQATGDEADDLMAEIRRACGLEES